MPRTTHLRLRAFTAAALLLALHVGCAAPLTTAVIPARANNEKSEPVAPVKPDDHSPRAVAVRKAVGEPAPSADEALAGVLKELQEIRAIDPEAEAQLMADLAEAKPEHYPLIVSTFRTALAYRQQLAERQHKAAAGAVDSPPSAAPALVRDAAQTSPPSQHDSALRAAAVGASLAASRPQPTEPAAAAVSTPPVVAPAQPAAEAVAVRPLAAAPPLSPLPPAAASTGRPDAAVQPASYAVAASPWQAQLESSIAALAGSVNPQPTSVAELHDHLRLRTLQLVAGRHEEAYRPIPGASPDQQDYWNRQLFAMAAYLDLSGQLDEKQRAAAALSALDESRDKLSELATLQVRNAAFVASVDGFGAYEPAKSTSFRPGDKVTIYAEVENYRTHETEDGFDARLATSYQVLDSAGRRVEGKQFPDVSDHCRNRRRDFHMHYQLPLPSRIDAGRYTLELTITDPSSGKIGQTTLPFEIAGN